MNEGKLIRGVDYTINNGILIVFDGVEYIPKFSFNDLCKEEEVTDILLPYTLKAIGEHAFDSAGVINKLVIPIGVKYIMNAAFEYCSIKELVIGDSVEYIGESAFSNNRLVNIKNKSVCLKLIDISAFAENNELDHRNFEMDYDVLVEESAFNDTLTPLSSPSTIDLGHMIVFDKYDTFDDYTESSIDQICNYMTTDKYTYKDGILKINEGVKILGCFSELKDCTAVEMPDSVLMIQKNAFENLEELESIIFSRNLFIIESSAFRNCSLRKKPLKLPSSLCYLDNSAFYLNNGKNLIQVPNTCTIEDYSVYQDFSSMYTEYPNNFKTNARVKTSTLNIKDMLESEKETLDNLGLLPYTIFLNKSLNNFLNIKQISIIENTLSELINNSDYDENNHIQFVSKLLELKEFDISNSDSLINTLFDRKQIKTIYLFISYGYDYTNNSMLARAIINGMNEMIDILLLLGANINEINTIDMTPLSVACQIGDATLVNHLIEKGAAINITDSRNKKAIDYAIESNHQNIVDLLSKYDDIDKDDTEKDIDELKKILG